jgi:DNA-binding NarL/FixJ family response regulator
MRILIVDDHALVRRGMAHVVKEGFPDADIVEADGTASALEMMRDGTADLALVDVRMPDLDGLELLYAIKAEWPDVPVIMLSAYENAPYVRRALAEGAAGYLLKDATPEDLHQAILVAITGGGNVLSPRVIQNLFDDVVSAAQSATGHGRARRTEYNLTKREHDILALVCEGRSNRSIAENLYLSEKTVKAHLAAIFRKLGVTNRTQAAMMAVQMGVGAAQGRVSGIGQKRTGDAQGPARPPVALAKH